MFEFNLIRRRIKNFLKTKNICVLALLGYIFHQRIKFSACPQVKRDYFHENLLMEEFINVLGLSRL
jgi:hypothetical protein